MPTLSIEVGSYTLVGAPSTVARELPLAGGSYTTTGTAATLFKGKLVQANIGSYTLTGLPVQSNRITAEPGAYLTGGQVAQLFGGSPRLFVDGGTYALTPTTAFIEHAVPSEHGIYTLAGTTATLSSTGDPTLGADVGVYGLTGTPAGLVHIYPIDSGDYLITGVDATLRPGKGVAATAGIYGINAVTTNLKAARKFTGGSRAFLVNGVNTWLQYSGGNAFGIAVESRAFALTGQAAVLDLNKRVTANAGSYTLTGTKTTLFQRFSSGAYLLTGTPATLQVFSASAANPGAYAITGIAATLIYSSKVLLANQGTFALFGFAAGLQRAYIMAATGGAYVHTGTVATLRATQIPALAGTYTFTGQAATLKASRKGRWRPVPTRPKPWSPQQDRDQTWDQQPHSPGV